MSDGIIVVGDSGHAKVSIELLQAMGRTVACCIGVSGMPTCHGIPVLHGDEHLVRLRGEGYVYAFVAVGANSVRRRLAAMVTDKGFELVNAISPRAVISPSVRIGNGVGIMAGAVINADAIISNLAIINTGACVDHDCRIGEAAHIGPTCGLAGNVIVGDGAFLGLGSKVIPGITIGENAVVGAGAVVIRDIASGIMAAGIPARLIQQLQRRKD